MIQEVLQFIEATNVINNTRSCHTPVRARYNIMASGGNAVDGEMEGGAVLSGEAMEEERKHFQKIANAFLYYK